MQSVNLNQKLAQFNDHWNPRIVGELNGQHVKLVKFLGPFTWHRHASEDEMFLVLQGRFRMEFREPSVGAPAPAVPDMADCRETAVWVEQGEFLIVPRGVLHRPVADSEVQVLLFEPASTLNTGDAGGPLTRATLERL